MTIVAAAATMGAAALSLGGCEAVLGLGSLKDAPDDASTASSSSSSGTNDSGSSGDGNTHVADGGSDGHAAGDGSTGVDATTDGASTDGASTDGATEASIPACSDPCLIASGLDNPWHVAADDTRVYWTEWGDDQGAANGSVKACPVGGCGDAGPLLYAQGLTNPRGVAVDTQNIYYATASYGSVNGGIWSCPLAGCGGSPKRLTTAGIPDGIFVTTTDVYWVDLDNSSINRVSKTGSSANVVLYDGGAGTIIEPTGCAGDNQFVYAADINEDIVRESVNGGLPVVMAVGPYGDRTAVAVDSNYVYYGFHGGIFRQAKTAVDAGVAIDDTIPAPIDLAVSNGFVYWADIGSNGGFTSDGTVGKVAIDGGGAQVLHAALAAPFAIAVNGSFAFWASQGVPDDAGVSLMPNTGKIFRTPK
jgi:hypothetical protein